jgi:hypothetical protein
LKIIQPRASQSPYDFQIKSRRVIEAIARNALESLETPIACCVAHIAGNSGRAMQAATQSRDWRQQPVGKLWIPPFHLKPDDGKARRRIPFMGLRLRSNKAAARFLVKPFGLRSF